MESTILGVEGGFQPHASPEMMEELRGSSSSDLSAIRALCQDDLWFLCRGVLNYNQLYEPLHGPLCNFLVHWPGRLVLVLMPRGWLKSTITTVANPIRKSLINPTAYRCGIFSADETKAVSFLSEIQAHWMNNEALRFLYPELVPTKLAGPGSKWSSTAAILNAARTKKEATYSALGAGGSGTGFHFDHIVPDDLVTDKHKIKRAEMETMKVWNRSVEQMLDNPSMDPIHWVGTRKDMDDAYGDMIERYGSELAIFHVEPFDAQGESTFPTKIPTWWLVQKMERDPEEWAHDYMNNPMGKGGIDWGKMAIRDFEFASGGRVAYIDEGVKKSWAIRDLDIVVTCDPNSGERHAPDKAAITAHGVSPDEDVFILASKADRWSPEELVDELWNTCAEWNARAVGIEVAGQQTTHFWFQKKCQKENRFFNVVELKPENKEKEVRVRQALDPLVKQRRIYTYPGQKSLRFQLEHHPQLAKHNRNEIDCTAYGPRMYRKGVASEEQDRQKDLHKKILAFRGPSGYGGGTKRRFG